jgi:hypothetical protein
MHLVREALFCWVLGALLVLTVGRSSVPTLGDVGTPSPTPTALLLPLLAATGVSFAVHHDAPILLGQRSRWVWHVQLLWATLALLVGGLVTAVGAEHSARITLAAGERNYLLFTALALVSLRVLPPGASAIPCAVAACSAIVLLSTQPQRTPQSWNWLVQSGTATTQLLVAAACCGLGLVSLVTQRPR